MMNCCGLVSDKNQPGINISIIINAVTFCFRLCNTLKTSISSRAGFTSNKYVIDVIEFGRIWLSSSNWRGTGRNWSMHH